MLLQDFFHHFISSGTIAHFFASAAFNNLMIA